MEATNEQIIAFFIWFAMLFVFYCIAPGGLIDILKERKKQKQNAQ